MYYIPSAVPGSTGEKVNEACPVGEGGDNGLAVSVSCSPPTALTYLRLTGKAGGQVSVVRATDVVLGTVYTRKINRH